METLPWLFVTIVFGFTLVAGISDLRTRRLPNWLTVPAFLAALAFHGLTGGWSGLGQALGGFAIGFGILFVLWLIGGGGGGDVKLMGALGAWLGPIPILIVFGLSTAFVVLGMIVTAVWELFAHGYSHVRRRYVPVATLGTGTVTSSRETQRRKNRRILPYALPVALGTWVFLGLKLLEMSQ